MRKNIVILFFIAIGFSPFTYGQKVKNIHLAWSANNFGYKVPVYNHFGFVGGLDFWEKSGKHVKQSLGANLGYYYFKGFEHSLMLDASYSLGYEFKFGLQPKVLVDLGYKASILEGDKYELDNGEYKKSSKIYGQSQVNLKLGVGLEYSFNDAIAIYLEAKLMAYYPYTPKAYIPFNINQIANFGIKYSFNKITQ